MALWWTLCPLVLAFLPAEALTLYDPWLCYILDGFLGLYGLVITAMFIKEKFFKTKVDGSYMVGRGKKAESGLQGTGDLERGRNHWLKDNATYTDLNKRTDGEYRELPAKRDRPRRKEQIYHGLSAANIETYDALQMQPLPVRATDRQTVVH
ncbi:T-cell surface glycoprotein CD3 zeta chain isoform X2 [Dunckerocampus dactyliophorus]|uniref:T-cell surface glycoprotein CD3 zeta chain isoform X2 n=1 Tax=Dunckerocampus dactyliophorus TaxID=161453 RepID=UPI0024073DBC|nr:T-cell surface glycoprotein CD3 zeta chain isoform X2 [Dunckerocampus dactyliophorus]